MPGPITKQGRLALLMGAARGGSASFQMDDGHRVKQKTISRTLKLMGFQ